MTIYHSTSQQTVWDVALQHFGDASGIAILLRDNDDLVSTNGLVQEGARSYRIDDDTILNAPIQSRMQQEIPSTGISSAQPWITDDEQDWTDNSGDSWWTS